MSIDSLYEKFDENITGCIVYIDMDMEPWEVGELIDNIYPIIKQKVSQIKLEVDGYRTYEEDYGGFMAHGVLTMDTNNLSKEDVDFIREVILENI